MASFDYNKEALKNLKLKNKETTLLDRLVDSESARKAHLTKDHSQKDKRISLKEAVQEYVQDGDVLSDGGFSYVRTSIQSFFEIIRQEKKNLQMIGSPNSNQSYMIATGTVSHSHCSYVGAEMRGTDRAFSESVKKGKTKVLSEWSHGSMALGFKAAQLGVAGLYSKSLLGSDIIKYNPYTKTMQNPMRSDSDPVAFVPSLYPDVAFIHVQKADRYGNGMIYGPLINDVAISAAARKIVITAEEIVPESYFRNNPQGVCIPFMYADAVVELPYGGVPGSVPGRYYWARQWWEKLMRWATRSEENINQFIDEWIYGTKDQLDFLEKLGGARFIIEAKRQTLAAEYENEDDGFDFSYEEWTKDNPVEKYY